MLFLIDVLFVVTDESYIGRNQINNKNFFYFFQQIAYMLQQIRHMLQ